ncbi:MAG: hypothetical protein R3F49_12465 [Planctomycetota bacterium]
MNCSQLISLFMAGALAPSAAADIFWTGAVSADIFNEANWDLTQSTVTIIDPNVTIDDNVVIRNAAATVEMPEVGGAGQMRFQIGEGYTLTVDNSRVLVLGNDGFGGIPGAVTGITIDVVNGASLEPFFTVNEVLVNIDQTSTIIYGGGGNPVNITLVDLTYGSTMRFLLEDPTEYTLEHLSKTFVDGVPAVIGGNIDVVSDGAMGSIVTVRPGQLGASYCAANTNSTGVAAAISASGSTRVARNNVILECGSMPNNSFAFFLTSTTRGLVANPGGSLGDLCLGGAIGRYVGPGQIKNAGTTGAVTLTLDLTMHPTPNGLITVVAGQTWNFQCWYRDVTPGGSAASNFSDGLEIAFN